MTDPKSFRKLLQLCNVELLALPEKELCSDLVELVLSGENPTEALRVCLALAVHSSVEVRGVVASCFGHLARLHRDLDLSRVEVALDQISADEQLKGRVEDAREDIEQFLKNIGRANDNE